MKPKNLGELDCNCINMAKVQDSGLVQHDYITHCLRWSYLLRHYQIIKNYRWTRTLDIGCGIDAPFLRLLAGNNLIPEESHGGVYIGLDLNDIPPLKIRVPKDAPIVLYSNCFFPSGFSTDYTFDVIACLEVIDRCTPFQGWEILRSIKKYLHSKGRAFVSCGNYFADKGVDSDKKNEVAFKAMPFFFGLAGLEVEQVYGTHATLKDLEGHMSREDEKFLVAMKEFYDQEYLTTLLAPKYPELSHNCVWKVKSAEIPLPSEEDFVEISSSYYSSSSDWTEFIKGIKEHGSPRE